MYFNSQQQQGKTRKNSKNMESLTSQMDGPIIDRAYIQDIFFCLQVDGPITGGVISAAGGGGGRVGGL